MCNEGMTRILPLMRLRQLQLHPSLLLLLLLP